MIDESTTDEEDEEDEDDDEDDEANTSTHVSNSFTDRLRNKIKLSSRRKKLSNDSLYQNTKITDLTTNNAASTVNSSIGNKSTRNKLAKLAQKTNRNRLIRSMQNLFYERSRSRSNSRDKLSSSADEDKSKPSLEKTKKSILYKQSLFDCF